MSQTIKIEMTGHGHGKVFVDGVQLTHAVAARVRIGVGESNRVLLMLAPEQVEITGPFDVATAQAEG